MNDETRMMLLSSIGQMILPLVSPHDTSRMALMHHHLNNPNFRAVEEGIFHLITDNPLTLEKVLNDMNIMQQLITTPHTTMP